MKKTTMILIASILVALPVLCTEIKMETHVENVTLYHTGALVTRISSTELNVGSNELIFWNISSKTVLNSIRILNKEVTILNKKIIKKLKSEEFNQLLDRQEAIARQIELIELKFHEAGFISNVEELEKMTAFYANKSLELKKELRHVKQVIEDANALNDVDLKNEDGAILKMVVSVSGPLKSALKIEYVCGGIGWSPYYEITVNNSTDEHIELKYFARAMSQTGEDWDDVSISLSSAYPLEPPTQLPKPISSWTIPNNYSNDQNPNNDANNGVQLVEKLSGVEYIELRAPSYLEKRKLDGRYSFKANNTVFTFPIMTVSLPAKFYYYGYPSIDPEVYLVSEVTGWETLGFIDGIANITYNHNEVGKSIIKFSDAADALFLPIGKDNNVYMNRSEIGDERFFKTKYISKKSKKTLAYQFDVKNNNSFAIDLLLMDQIPISQTQMAEVELNTISGGALNKEIGEITWKLRLEPGATEHKELIFTIETNGNYRYLTRKTNTNFRAINCPSF